MSEPLTEAQLEKVRIKYQTEFDKIKIKMSDFVKQIDCLEFSGKDTETSLKSDLQRLNELMILIKRVADMKDNISIDKQIFAASLKL